jgi:hypothetical protein
MIDVLFRYMKKPEKWKSIGTDAVRSFRGKITWSKAFNLLRYELGRIGATDVVIEAGYEPNQVRNDGWPYSNAKPEHTAVRVSFRKRGKVSMAFLCAGWNGVEYNVHMIGLTLERLRAVERYGCVQGEEQYKGWAQLPPGANEGRAPINAEEFATIEDAMRFLCRVSDGEVLSTLPADLDLVYKAAAKRAHPDKPTGSGELMAKVNRARDYVARMAGDGT